MLSGSKFIIDPSFFTDVKCEVGWGEDMFMHWHEDHPSFAYLRRHLDANGFIKACNVSVNGDVVKKEFTLNGHLFAPGDRFPSAAAMANTVFWSK